MWYAHVLPFRQTHARRSLEVRGGETPLSCASTAHPLVEALGRVGRTSAWGPDASSPSALGLSAQQGSQAWGRVATGLDAACTLDWVFPVTEAAHWWRPHHRMVPKTKVQRGKDSPKVSRTQMGEERKRSRGIRRRRKVGGGGPSVTK